MYRIYCNSLFYYIDSDFFDDKFLSKNNITQTYIQSFLKKNSKTFYRYKVYNEQIFEDIKKEFFHRIIMGDFKITSFSERSIFFAKEVYYKDSFSLYRDKIFNLNEIKKLHNIFSKYTEDYDYDFEEELFFTTRKSANDIIKKLKNYYSRWTDYSIIEHNIN
jgi:hypothetical protein